MAIEKFKGRLTKEDSGFVMMLNDSINMLASIDLAAAGLYAYLAARPQEWELNPEQLRTVCHTSKDKMYRLLNVIIDSGLMTRAKVVTKGRFVGYDYRLKIRPYSQVLPNPDFQDTEKQEPENQDAYKTKNLKNKDNKKPISDLEKSPNNNQGQKTKNVVQAYHEELPDNPKIKVVDHRLESQIKRMIKDWSKYQSEGKPFTLDSFRDYLRVIKEHHPWFIKPYTTKSGNKKQNNLRVFTRETNITKIVNGEFSAD